MRTLAVLLIVAVPSLARAERPKIAVLPTQFDTSSKGQVPSLFDDYLLTSVQNVGLYDVIGQEDISTILGFEKQKDIFDCDDTSCIADIGGALGVDKIVIVKIAKLDRDWVSTAKIINIRETRVEARVTDITPGDVKALLRNVDNLVRKLFNQSPASPAGPRPPQTRPPPPSYQPPPGQRPPAGYTQPPPGYPGQPGVGQSVPNDAMGSGSRTAGTVMLVLGAALALGGGLIFTLFESTPPFEFGPGCYWSYVNEFEVCPGHVDYIPSLADDPDFNDPENVPALADEIGGALDGLAWAGGAILTVAGLALEGIGAKMRANGVAQAQLGNEGASGSPMVLYWLGWAGAAATLGAPIYGFAADDSDATDAAIAWGWIAGGITTVVFAISAFVGIDAQMASLMPRMDIRFARDPGGGSSQHYGLALDW